MLELGLQPFLDEGYVWVQDEPALEIALPQVFIQPALGSLRRRKLSNVEALIAAIYRRYAPNPFGSLGKDYQALVTEFQPLFAWAIACWDYLLSTEGCRFVPRSSEQRFVARGNYRVFTDRDFSRLIHRIFRIEVLAFAQQPDAPSLSHWLKGHFWMNAVSAYRLLENPPDPRERTLTQYSYLRCIPYRFLNNFHQELVYGTVHRLPALERHAIETYFFNFNTESATASSLGSTPDACQGYLRQGLTKLLIRDRLVYCLLRQIERY